jgi:hypothetical protein
VQPSSELVPTNGFEGPSDLPLFFFSKIVIRFLDIMTFFEFSCVSLFSEIKKVIVVGLEIFHPGFGLLAETRSTHSL